MPDATAPDSKLVIWAQGGCRASGSRTGSTAEALAPPELPTHGWPISAYVSDQARVVSTQDYEIDPTFAVAVIIVDSALLPDVLGGDKFDVIVDPVGGFVRAQSLDLLAPEPAVEMPVTWPAGSSG